MEKAALVYLDLLDGKDKPVAGATCEFLNVTLEVVQIHRHTHRMVLN